VRYGTSPPNAFAVRVRNHLVSTSNIDCMVCDWPGNVCMRASACEDNKIINSRATGMAARRRRPPVVHRNIDHLCSGKELLLQWTLKWSESCQSGPLANTDLGFCLVEDGIPVWIKKRAWQEYVNLSSPQIHTLRKILPTIPNALLTRFETTAGSGIMRTKKKATHHTICHAIIGVAKSAVNF
jgi:hypothetical protein